ncbi:acetyl-CoA carboxylase biotin carboxyl carrier protein [Geodermatophilus dictyosporus]|uniref:Biotin carboxyl carrier protein of acetyl-CoA carboxylase n=1 Tax=Geodermatophilus dictyosporus TaxID=1523247 RepID=A0A1I5SK26_9ACTN|nr:acetyl-CoA carboxylase biotin carboxyl carrier protein [Geodermatophilus dictyosporus]SFP71085.1 acetyl-CoA carboxylase biotin carboxyl carrier protein [Geodermatophilus dictyosporus]
MAASELSTRSAGPDPDAVRDLHDEVVALARDLPAGLRRLTVRDGDRAVEVEWATGPAEGTVMAVAPVAAVVPATAAAATPAEPEGTPVRSPLVGTFYAAPSPGADPFVRVGDEVEPGQTVGIVEAMKLMNPIVVDEAGVVADVLVGDAESVEYDQVLMLLRPAGGAR